MFAGTPYGLRYSAPLAAADGLVYVAKIEMASYSGPSTRLAPPLDGIASLVIDGGQAAGQPGDELAPIAASVATLTVLDGRARLGALAGYADGVVRLRLYSGATEATATDLEWAGYLLPESVEDAPLDGRNAVSLRFMDGLGLLDSRAHAGVGTPYTSSLAWTYLPGEYDSASMVKQIARHLGALGGGSGASDAAWAGLTTCTDWRPYVGVGAGEVAAGTDPLHAVACYADAWLDEDGASQTALEALRQIAARFNAQLYQSRGRWRLDQRGALARAYGGDGVTGSAAGTVPTWAYAADGSGAVTVPASSPTRTDESRVVDVHASGNVEASPVRTFPPPVRSVETRYEFRPALTNVVLNGSFETAGASATLAESWTFSGAVRTDQSVLDASLTDRYHCRIAASDFDDAGPRNSAVQSGETFIPGSLEGATFRLSYWISETAEAQYLNPWRLTLEFADVDGTVGHGLHYAATEFGASLAGPGATLALTDPFLDGVSGAVAGVTVYPVGAELLIGTATLRLTRPLKVDDTRVFGTLSEAIGSATTAHLPYLKAGAGEAREGDLVGAKTVDFYLHAVDGGEVAGYPKITFEGPEDDTGSPGSYDPDPGGGTPPAGRSYLLVDDVVLSVEYGGQASTSEARNAALPAGTAGVPAALPVRAGDALYVGDGPHVESLSRLQVVGANGTTYDTLQGADTGWTEGSYPSDGSAVSTARTIGALGALDALRQLVGPVAGGPSERWSGVVDLASVTARAHHVLRVWQRTTTANYCSAGQPTALLYAAPRPGETVTFDPGGPTEETLTVDSVTRGDAVHEVTFTTNFATARGAGVRAHYTLAVWRDGWRWDVGAGRLHVDATALAVGPVPSVIESTTLS